MPEADQTRGGGGAGQLPTSFGVLVRAVLLAAGELARVLSLGPLR